MSTQYFFRKVLTTRLLPLFGALALACSFVPAAASAQVPSYATADGETIRGTISAINGKYAISVRDERGFVDNVSLHDGTIINPTGLTLAPGQSVSITGHAAGSTFVANEIDTPYAFYGYPYPVYPYAPFGFGVRFVGRGFGFGFHG